MLLNSPCPKCREPMLAGTTKCRHCRYRPTPWEVGRSKRLAGGKLLAAALVIAAAIFAYIHSGS